MTNIPSKLAGYFALILMMILGVFILLIQFDSVIEDNIVGETTKFVNECQTTGKISASNYNRFCKKIQKGGRYSVELEYQSLRSYPIEDGAGNVTGFNRDWYAYNNKDILDEMFSGQESIDYMMKNGDKLIVTVRNKGSVKANAFTRLLHINMNNAVVTRIPGTIGNNVQ